MSPSPSHSPTFPAPISEAIWSLKYQFAGDKAAGLAPDDTLAGTFERVATAVAAVESGGKAKRAKWAARFYGGLSDFGFLPAGRILAGAGTGRQVTLFNCFVMGRIDDDLGAIFENVKEAALTMQQGGGIGHDFSTLRPKGALVKSIGADASGPVNFMDVWDAMCRTIMSAGARRGAMMATMRCDHPDIEEFIDAKADAQRLRNFNLSVLVTDDFMAAVDGDLDWNLVFGGKIYRTLKARALWDRLMRATYDYAEPGVVFIDRINARNNLGYCETISATNPCGEQPLPPYGACLLGSINLTRFVRKPFTADASLDVGSIEERAALAVRFLDNVIDVSGFPLAAQRQEAHAKRRIGLGVTGLADALAMLDVTYGSERAALLAGQWMAAIERAAYLTSAEIARDKGAFPLLDSGRFLERPQIAGLDKDVRRAIRKHGIRNGCLTSIAPTGTISLLAGNVSSGIEPIFDLVAERRILGADGVPRQDRLEDYAFAEFKRAHGPDAGLPSAFVTAAGLSPRDHLVMQAAVQKHVDSSISKTINCPADVAFGDFKTVYRDAYDMGLKGCTTFRPNAVTGAVLTPVATVSAAETASPQTQTPAEPAMPAVVPAAARTVSVAAPKSGIVYMAEPLERQTELSGYTYKLKWPESDHAIYVTINDIEVDGTGAAAGQKRRRPFEIFINTRNLEHYAWTVALTRMISAVFRRGGDVSFVADELKAVFDPQGGRWIDGRYQPSLLAAIGEIIEKHMVRTGFRAAAESHEVRPKAQSAAADWGNIATSEGVGSPPTRAATGRSCPRCASLTFIRRDGCWTCDSCGFSRCD